MLISYFVRPGRIGKTLASGAGRGALRGLEGLRGILSCLLIASLWPLSVAAAPETLQHIDFQLRWKHQFQFAGYYAAIEQGYYREAGFDVTLHEGSSKHTPVEAVLSGRAQYGQSNSEVLYERLKGKPLVALAAIFQHSPSVLLARADSGIRTPHDLVGKKVMLLDERNEAEFHTMLLREGVPTERVELLPTSYDIEDLVTGQIDAFNAYLTNEPFVLKQRGIRYVVLNPADYGIDYYSDILFTSEQELAEHPERVAAFRAATLRGWRYAMDHPDEIIDILIRKYRVRKSRAHLQFEVDAMRPLILPDLVEIGHMNPGRWQRMARVFAEAGMVDGAADLSLEGFLYDPRWRDTGRMKRTIKLLAGVSGVVLVVLMIMGVLQVRMRREIDLRRKAEADLAKSNELLKKTGSLARVGGWEFDLATGVTRWTDEAARIREIPPGTVMTEAQTLAAFDDDTRTRMQAMREAALKGAPWDTEHTLTTATGRQIWVRAQGEAVLRDGQAVGLRGAMQDITERKLFELALLRRTRELEAHNGVLQRIHLGTPLREVLSYLARQFELGHPGMLCSILRVDAESQRLVHAAAPSLPAFFIDEAGEISVGEGVAACGTAAFRRKRVIIDDLRGHPYAAVAGDLFERAGLRSCWSQPILGRAGEVLGTFAIYQRQPGMPTEEDASLVESYATLAQLAIERELTDERIRNLAYFDALTGLPNRRMLEDRLSLAMASSKRSGSHAAVMFLDLDNFKPLNDRFGHAAGDLLLAQVALRLKSCVREMDTVARFGGDEFIVMLNDLGEGKEEAEMQAARVAEKIRSIIGAPYALSLQQADGGTREASHSCTVSIGIVLFANHEAGTDDILKWADMAMYQAKDGGRDCIRFYA